jgi:ribosomal protein L37E
MERRGTEVGARASVLKVVVMLVYDDNFGFWNLGGPQERAFFDYVQSHSVSTVCERCGQPVRLIRPKTICACCASALEYGAPASMREYGCGQKPLLDSTHPT